MTRLPRQASSRAEPGVVPGSAGLQPGSRSHAGAWRSQAEGTGAGLTKWTSRTGEGPAVSTLHARATSGACGLWHAYLNWRYAILFYSLLLTLAVGPLRSALGLRANLLELFLAINLLAAVAPIGGRKTRLVLLTILVVALAGRGGTAWLDQAALVPMSLALWTVIALLAAASALRFALGARVVDREHLYAALSAYLLAGIFFGVFNWVLSAPGQARLPYPVRVVRAIFHSSRRFTIAS